MKPWLIPVPPQVGLAPSERSAFQISLYQTVSSLALIFQRCLSDRRCLQPIFKAVIGEV